MESSFIRSNGNTVGSGNHSAGRDIYNNGIKCEHICLAMIIFQVILSVVIVILMLDFRAALDAHNDNVASINTTTSLVISANSEEQKRYLLERLHNICDGNGKKYSFGDDYYYTDPAGR